MWRRHRGYRHWPPNGGESAIRGDRPLRGPGLFSVQPPMLVVQVDLLAFDEKLLHLRLRLERVAVGDHEAGPFAWTPVEADGSFAFWMPNFGIWGERVCVR